VTPLQSAAGEVDPVQRLANQHAQELAMIQQFEQQGVLAHENALALKMLLINSMSKQNRCAVATTQPAKPRLRHADGAVDAFSGNASNALTGLLTGTMSAQEAFRSLGNTILNSVINSIVQMGVEALKTHSRADSWSGIRGFLSWYGCNHGNRLGTCCHWHLLPLWSGGSSIRRHHLNGWFSPRTGINWRSL
jgi:hypothetical protein